MANIDTEIVHGDAKDVRYAADLLEKYESAVATLLGRRPKRDRFIDALRRLADKLDRIALG